MIKSKAERDQLAQLALEQLKGAQRTRQNYDDLLQAAIAVHGHPTGTPTSGIYNEAFPDHIKDELRTLAHNIGVQVQAAYALWRRAGRKTFTLRPMAQKARQLRDGRESYY